MFPSAFSEHIVDNRRTPINDCPRQVYTPFAGASLFETYLQKASIKGAIFPVFLPVSRELARRRVRERLRPPPASLLFHILRSQWAKTSLFPRIMPQCGFLQVGAILSGARKGGDQVEFLRGGIE